MDRLTRVTVIKQEAR